MIIEPPKGAGALAFGMTGEQVEELLGRPAETRLDNEHGVDIWDYGRPEVAGAYFVNDKLASLLIVPTAETMLWGKVLHRMPAESIKELLAANRHGFVCIPSCHPAVRPQILCRTAGLYFALKDDCCDDIEVLDLRSQVSMTT